MKCAWQLAKLFPKYSLAKSHILAVLSCKLLKNSISVRSSHHKPKLYLLHHTVKHQLKIRPQNISSPLSLGEGSGVRLLIILLIILNQLRHHFLNRAYYHVVGNLVDGSFRITVHRDDDT